MNTHDLRRDLEEIEVRINRVIAGDKPGDIDYLSEHDAEMWAKEIFNKLTARIKEAYTEEKDVYKNYWLD